MASTSAESLAELGAQIGGIFERRSQEAQFRNSLPVMQTAFQQAIQDFDQGRSAAGYARIMDVAMRYPNNPMVQNMSQMAFRIGQAASDDYMARQRMMRTGGGGGGGGGGGLTEQQMEEYLATGTVSEGIPAVSAGAVPTTGAMQPAAQPQAAPTPTIPQQAQIVEPETMPEEKEVDEDYKPKLGEQRIDTPWLEWLGVQGLVGEAEYEKKVPKISKRTTVSSTGLISKGKTEEETTEKVNVDAAKKFREDVAKGKLKFEELRANKQLSQIFENSGRNFENIDLDTEGSGTDKTYTASVVNPETNQIIDSELSDEEYNTLRYFKTEAQEFVNRPGIKFVRKKQEAAPTRGVQAAQPAAQAQQFVEGKIYKQGGKRYRFTNGNFVEIQ